MPGWDEHPRAGYPDGDPYEMPPDLAAVQADDALLDMIGAGLAPDHADDELTRVLAAWRREVHAEPVPELVDTSTALAVIRAAARQPARRHRNPLFGTAAAVAAMLVISFSGVGLVAKSAQPGDNLWGVTQVLYKDYARSVETAAAVRTELNEANAALKQHNPERAKAALQRVQQQLPVIGEAEGLTDLTARHRQLEQRLLTGAPDTDPANAPGAPASPSSRPAAVSPDAEPKTGGPRQSPGPSTSVESTPTPESAKNLDGSSTPNSSQFLPDGYPHRRYPPPGGTSRGNVSPEGDGVHPDGDASGNGTASGRTPTPTPTPAPAPAGGYRGGMEPNTNFTGGPKPPENRFHPVCEHPSPQPPYCG